MPATTPKISPKTVSGINLLPRDEIRAIYTRLVPPEIIERFHLSKDLLDQDGNDLVMLTCERGTADAEMGLYHQIGATDPVLYGHITDTVSGQIHILLYVLNDPDSERYNIDRMPDGSSTMLGASKRNLEEEIRSMNAGLAPGQVRRGLRLLFPATTQFEKFVESLGHDIYFAEPLFYHTALLFEKYGFTYQQGRKLMENISEGFAPGGELRNRLDKSSPFRQPGAIDSIRLRSWAIHDGILGEPFTNVTMYKRVGKSAGVNNSADIPW